MKTTVVIPTYNERENIGELVESIYSSGNRVDIVVVDDNSPDGTAEVVKNMQKKFNRLFLIERGKKGGLGDAFQDACNHILNDPETEVIITMDADLSHSPEDLRPLIALSETSDLVIGSRYMKESRISEWSLIRKMVSRVGNWYLQVLLKVPIKDITAGFTAIKTSGLRSIINDIVTKDYAFPVELKYRLYKKNATVKEMPISFRGRRRGYSKISLKAAFEVLLFPFLCK